MLAETERDQRLSSASVNTESEYLKQPPMVECSLQQANWATVNRSYVNLAVFSLTFGLERPLLTEKYRLPCTSWWLDLHHRTRWVRQGPESIITNPSPYIDLASLFLEFPSSSSLRRDRSLRWTHPSPWIPLFRPTRIVYVFFLSRHRRLTPFCAGIFSSSVKENILFGKDFNHKLFQRVTHVTALDTVRSLLKIAQWDCCLLHRTSSSCLTARTHSSAIKVWCCLV